MREGCETEHCLRYGIDGNFVGNVELMGTIRIVPGQ